jgi:hypothetical protein
MPILYPMEVPSPEQLGAELVTLRAAAARLPDDDPDAVIEHLAKLRALAVHLNAHVLAPSIPQA